MNFDLDDPLEGLLSDGSNDSLFGNEPTKKSIAKPSTNKPSKMQDLFGIKTDSVAPGMEPPVSAAPQPVSLDFSKPASGQQPSSLTGQQTKKAATPVKKPPNEPAVPPQRKEITFDDDGDLLSDLGFDPKKPKSKSNILDDILSGPIITTAKDVTTKSSKPKQTLSIMKEEVGSGGKSAATISRQSTETSENLQTESTVMGGYAPSGGSGARRSGRRKSSVATLNDPLGLFSTPTAEEKSRRDSKATKRGSADWLGLNDDSGTNEVDTGPLVRLEFEVPKMVAPPELKVPPVADIGKYEVAAPPAVVHLPQPQPPPPNVVMSVLAQPDLQTAAQTMETLNLETQGALQTMQQQEFRLMVAGQMRNQERALYDMQQKQQSILQRQEAQFNELLQKQMQRHGVLEETIAKQQERINANIHAIMCHPVTADGLQPAATGSASTGENEPLVQVELQTDLKRLELEKLRLEDLVANVSANHEQEIALLEQSYRKQLGFLEESLKVTETRMKADNRQLEGFYKAKVDALESELQEVGAEHAAKQATMEERHQKVVAKLQAEYDAGLEELRRDNRETIGRIRESKLLELAVVQENQSYLQVLKNASDHLENASGDLGQLRDTLQDQIEFVQKEKDIQLRAREKQVEDQQRLLERTKQASEEEKTRLLSLVEMLEVKLTDMTKTASEEHWMYQQNSAKLVAERQIFEKEKQFQRQRLEREEVRLEELRQLQRDEHERLMLTIQQERQTVLEEKAKLDTLSALRRKDPEERSREEIEAAIRVANDAAKKADQERDRYLQMQRKLEATKRELLLQETQQRSKDDDLEAALGRARLKEQNVERLYRSVKKAEQGVQRKAQLLQEQFREISNREDRLSEEKIALSKERLEMQATRRRLQQTRCSLCKIGERSQQVASELLANTNSEPVADDRKLEVTLAEMLQQRNGATWGMPSTEQCFLDDDDDDVDRRVQRFLSSHKLDATGDVSDTEVAMLRFDTLREQNFFDKPNNDNSS